MLKAFSRKIHREWDKLTMEGLAISVSLLQPDIRYQVNPCFCFYIIFSYFLHSSLDEFQSKSK